MQLTTGNRQPKNASVQIAWVQSGREDLGNAGAQGVMRGIGSKSRLGKLGNAPNVSWMLVVNQYFTAFARFETHDPNFMRQGSVAVESNRAERYKSRRRHGGSALEATSKLPTAKIKSHDEGGVQEPRRNIILSLKWGDVSEVGQFGAVPLPHLLWRTYSKAFGCRRGPLWPE